MRRRQHKLNRIVLAAIASLSVLLPIPQASLQPGPALSAPLRPRLTCPARLEDLMPLLLRDLPSYANRVNQRAYPSGNPDTPGYVLIAGQPDYQPLSLAAGAKVPKVEGTPQIFFTTLERQYVAGKPVRLQNHHWLFLTPTAEQGWRLVLMFSAIEDYPSDRPPAPTIDASQGVIAQAIRLWLRDCQAGSLDSLLDSLNVPAD